jgi:hypothetical protein
MMGQSLLHRRRSSERGVDLSGAFPQKEASDLFRKMTAGLERSAKTPVKNEPEGTLPDQSFQQFRRQRYALRPWDLRLDRNVTGAIIAEGGPHPPANDRPADHSGQDISQRPENGEDSNLPKWPPHIALFSMPGIGSRMETISDKKLPNWRKGDNQILSSFIFFVSANSAISAVHFFVPRILPRWPVSKFIPAQPKNYLALPPFPLYIIGQKSGGATG